MCYSTWKSPAFSNSSKDTQVTTHVKSCWSCAVRAGLRGVSGCQRSEGGVSQALCSLCCSSPQLCICPQVSSCLSVCYDVLAALVRCLSVTETIYPHVSSLLSLHLCL